MMVDQVLDAFTATASRPSRLQAGLPPQAEGSENSNPAPKAFLSDIRRGAAPNFSKEKPCKRVVITLKSNRIVKHYYTNTYINIK